MLLFWPRTGSIRRHDFSHPHLLSFRPPFTPFYPSEGRKNMLGLFVRPPGPGKRGCCARGGGGHSCSLQARRAVVVVVVVVTEVVPAGSPDYFFLFVGKVYLVCSTKKSTRGSNFFAGTSRRRRRRGRGRSRTSGFARLRYTFFVVRKQKVPAEAIFI